MLAFVDEAAETIAPPDVEPGELVRVGDLLGEWLQGSSVRDSPMGSVTVVVPFILAQGVQEMRVVPDERAVE